MGIAKVLLAFGLLVLIENVNAQSYQQTAVDLHNQYRAKHGSPPLTLDDNLNNLAAQCAKYYAQKQAIDHTCPYKGDAGENLVGGQGTWSQSDFATMGTNMWYDEESSYDYSNPGFSMSTGHFTQLVWKSSQTFGFGVTTINGYTAGVGLYSPPGNYEGEYEQNVLPPQ